MTDYKPGDVNERGELLSFTGWTARGIYLCNQKQAAVAVKRGWIDDGPSGHFRVIRRGVDRPDSVRTDRVRHDHGAALAAPISNPTDPRITRLIDRIAHLNPTVGDIGAGGATSRRRPNPGGRHEFIHHRRHLQTPRRWPVQVFGGGVMKEIFMSTPGMETGRVWRWNEDRMTDDHAPFLEREPIRPFVEGYPDKGGLNAPSDAPFVRPEAPAAMRRDDDIAQRAEIRRQRAAPLRDRIALAIGLLFKSNKAPTFGEIADVAIAEYEREEK